MRDWGKEYNFIQKADQQDVRLASQNNHLVGVWMPVSFMGQRWGEGEETKKTMPLILQIFLEWQASGMGVLVSSFLLSAGGQGSEQRHFNSQADGQGPLKQATMCDHNNKSNGKQVKETVSTWRQNQLLPHQ